MKMKIAWIGVGLKNVVTKYRRMKCKIKRGQELYRRMAGDGNGTWVKPRGKL